jgi:predicted glycosyltransferase
MRILVEITHPAHVHFFRNAINIWKNHGHEVAVTAREKDVIIELLKNYNIPYKVLSKAGKGLLSLAGEMCLRDMRLLRLCRDFRPDILTGVFGVYAAHAGFLTGIPVVVWDDTEHEKISHMLTYRFVNAVYSPDCYGKRFGNKHHFYPGCHELAYLHPKRFAPDADTVRQVGINPDEKYCIIRFVGWQAHHDVGQRGFVEEQKLSFIKEIAKYARPYISSESPLPEELEPYRLNVPVHLIHHIMAFASLCVGEGATMASESAILGVPAVYVNTLRTGYIDMHERYGLLKQTTNTNEALKLCLEFLTGQNVKERCRIAQQKLLNEKIDVTAYVVETIEQWH